MNWTGPVDWTYKFYTEDGYFEIEYSDYLGDFGKTHEDSELMEKVKNRVGRENLYLGRTIVSYDKEWLKEHPAEQEMVDYLREEQNTNPLQFYCPNGLNMRRFLNDTEHDIKGLLAGNRTGKTTAGWIDLLLDIVPCDPTWKIFTEHGITWRPFAPPKDGFVTAIASYERVNIESTIWPQVVRLWTPLPYLGNYVIEGKGRKKINFQTIPRVMTPELNLWFMYYSMSQTPYESQAVDRFLWDEQGEEQKFDGADERLRTRNGRHVFSLTPHKVEGRPDTGAGTWIHDLDNNFVTKGHNVKFYRQSMLNGVPDWIYPEKQKVIAYKKWIQEPEERGDRKTRKEGESRLFGGWHETGGLVYDEWDRKIHLVDPFDIPKTWTCFRALDWGRVQPTACVWGAVNPEGDLYIYDTWLKPNALVSEIAQEVVKRSGNKLVCVDKGFDPRTGQVYKRYKEIFSGRKFYRTVMDGRSIKTKTPNSTMTLGRMFQNSGLLVHPACTDDTYLTVPIVKEWLNPDFSKENPHSGEMGRPRVFVFRNQAKFINHIEHYVNKAVTRKSKVSGDYLAERPEAKDDHDMDAFRYMIMIPPRFVEGFGRMEKDEFDDDDDDYRGTVAKRAVDPYTGY